MKKVLILFGLCVATFTSNAGLKINGFANLIGGKTNNDSGLSGYSEDLTFSEESLFALQVTGEINDKLSATAQIIAKSEDNYRSEFAWAYISYQANTHWNLSAGRFRLPLFRYSDSADVGYSYHWLSAPRSVYAAGGFNIEGINARYSNYIGNWEVNSQISIGNFKDKAGDVEFDGNNLFFLVGDAQYEWFKIRGVAGRLNMNVNAPALNDILDQLAVFAPTLANDLSTDDDTMRFLGLSLEADFATWFIASELTTFDIVNSASPKDTSYYITTGIRSGKWTPSITFEEKQADELKFLTEVSELSAEVQPIAQGIVIGIQQPSLESYKAVTLSTRYDWDTSIALKWEVARYSDKLNDARSQTLINFGINYVF